MFSMGFLDPRAFPCARCLPRRMATFPLLAFYRGALCESDDDFSEEENCVPPSDVLFVVIEQQKQVRGKLFFCKACSNNHSVHPGECFERFHTLFKYPKGVSRRMHEKK